MGGGGGEGEGRGRGGGPFSRQINKSYYHSCPRQNVILISRKKIQMSQSKPLLLASNLVKVKVSGLSRKRKQLTTTQVSGPNI